MNAETSALLGYGMPMNDSQPEKKEKMYTDRYERLRHTRKEIRYGSEQ